MKRHRRMAHGPKRHPRASSGRQPSNRPPVVRIAPNQPRARNERAGRATHLHRYRRRHPKPRLQRAKRRRRLRSQRRWRHVSDRRVSSRPRRAWSDQRGWSRPRRASSSRRAWSRLLRERSGPDALKRRARRRRRYRAPRHRRSLRQRAKRRRRLPLDQKLHLRASSGRRPPSRPPANAPNTPKLRSAWNAPGTALNNVSNELSVSQTLVAPRQASRTASDHNTRP